MESIKQRLEEQLKKTQIRIMCTYPYVRIDIHTVSELETVLKHNIQQGQHFGNNISLFCYDDPIECIFGCSNQNDMKSLCTTTINQDTLVKMLKSILQYLETRKGFSKSEIEESLKDELAEIELSLDDLLDDKAFFTKKLYELQGKTILDEDTNKRIENMSNRRNVVLEEIKNKLKF